MTGIEVIIGILKLNPDIGALGFHVYPPGDNIAEGQNPSFSKLLFHDFSREIFTLDRREIMSNTKLKEIRMNLNDENFVIAVLSKVKIKGKIIRHIPIMDFSCDESNNSLERIKYFLKEISQQGAILCSGRSYHYYGIDLMTQDEWLNFLADCGLSGLADSRYIMHRLKDRCGILRLTSCPLRPKVPKVISILE